MRSALVWLGAGDPVKTIAKAVADDPERQTFGAVLTAWADTLDGSGIAVADLVGAANRRNSDESYANQDLRLALLAVAAGKGGQISHVRLGNWLRDHRDRVLGPLCLQRHGVGGGSHVARWCVVRR